MRAVTHKQAYYNAAHNCITTKSVALSDCLWPADSCHYFFAFEIEENMSNKGADLVALEADVQVQLQAASEARSWPCPR